MNQPKPTLTLVATLHEPIDATVLAAVLHANSGMPIGPWAATAFEVRVHNAVRGGACLEIYRREYREPETPEQALERRVRELAQGQARAHFDAQLGRLSDHEGTPAMAEHRTHAAMYAEAVPYNVDGSDTPASSDPNAGYTGARA